MYQEYKIKIKVNNIQHLTDARYFAAAGVDFMGFNLIGMEGDDLETEMTKIAAIREWVSGPDLFVQIEQATEELLENLLKNDLRNIEVVQHSALFGHDDFNWFYRGVLSNEQSNCSAILDYKAWEEMNFPKVYVSNFQREHLLEITDKNALGIELEGSPQEKVGIKLYDFYDEILEELEES